MRNLIFRNRTFAVLLLSAVLAGALYIYPDLRFILSQDGGYRGIPMTATNDELGYIGQINAFYKGGNTFLSGYDSYEHAGEAWTFGFLPPALQGALGRLFSVDAVRFDLVMSFILPAILFILAYILAFKMNGSAGYSLLSSFAVLFGYHIFSGKPAIIAEILKLRYAEPLWFLRPISPQFNHIILLLSLIFIYMAIGEKKRWALWASGVTVGALFYSFFYYWTFVYAGLFVLLVISLLRKESFAAKGISAILLISFVISVPYWINFWNLAHLSGYRDLEYFHNIWRTRKPIFPASHILLTALILISFLRKKKDFSFFFTAAFLAGGLLCLNQQLITGKVLFAGHWLGYSNKTFLIIALISSFKNIDNRLPVKKIVFAAALSLFVALAAVQQNNYFRKNAPFFAKKQSVSGVLRWLQDNADRNDVVLTDPFNTVEGSFPEGRDILSFTRSFTFTPSSPGTIYRRKELEDRLFIAMAVLGYAPEQALRLFTYNNGVYFICMNALPEYGGRGMPDSDIERLNAAYRMLINDGAMAEALKKFRLNYILVNNSVQGSRSIKFVKPSPVYRDSDFTVYRVG